MEVPGASHMAIDDVMARNWKVKKEDKEKERNAADVKLLMLQFGRPNLMIFGQTPTEGIVNFVLV